MNFKDLKLESNVQDHVIEFDDGAKLTVRGYLPINEKTALIEYVVGQALDQNTGRFSPIRVETFFGLAVAHYYAGINFEDDLKAAETYDMLETSGLMNEIVGNIPESEYNYIQELMQDTISDIADFNSSFAGILRIAQADAEGLDSQTKALIERIQGSEGQGLATLLKNVVENG